MPHFSLLTDAGPETPPGVLGFTPLLRRIRYAHAHIRECSTTPYWPRLLPFRFARGPAFIPSTISPMLLKVVSSVQHDPPERSAATLTGADVHTLSTT
jgi:hypothetical protein